MEDRSDMSRYVGQQVRRWRKSRGFGSQAALAAALSAEGVETSRDVIANLELGRRERIAVEELLALALVLNLSPLDLLVPDEAAHEATYRITPKTEAYAARVRGWISGQPALHESEDDAREFMAAAPEGRRAAWERRNHPALRAANSLLGSVLDAVTEPPTAESDDPDHDPVMEEVDRDLEGLRTVIETLRRERRAQRREQLDGRKTDRREWIRDWLEGQSE